MGWTEALEKAMQAKLKREHGREGGRIKQERAEQNATGQASTENNPAESAQQNPAEANPNLRRQYRQNRNRWLGYGALGGAAATGGYMLGAASRGGNAVRGGAQAAWGGVRNTAAYDILILATIIIYFFAAVWRAGFMSRMVVHGLILLAVLVFVLSPSERNGQTYLVIAMIFLIEVFLPQIAYQLPVLLTNKFIVNYLLNPQVTLLWFYFAVFRADRSTFISRWAYRLVFLVWVAILLSFLATSLTFDDIRTPLTPEQIAAAESLYTRSAKWYADAFANIKEIGRQGTDYWKRRMAYATGDMYTGYVDEKQYETLGVFLKDLKSADTQFMQGDTVTVWGMLEARTLEDGLRIDLRCYHGRPGTDGTFPDSQLGEVYPDTIPLVYDHERVDIDCRFPGGGGMPSGSNRVTMIADFHFETMAYLKTYFIDRDRLRSMTQQGIDPLQGIEDKNPVARYTNGPVRIGMGSAEQPIGISDSFSVKPKLGITLDTNDQWKGKIKQLEELIIMVPDSMSLDTAICPEFAEIKKEDYEAGCIAKYRQYRSQQLLQCAKDAGLDTELDIDQNGNILGDKAHIVDGCMLEHCQAELENYRAYSLIISDDTKRLYTNIGYDADERYKTFSCRVSLDNPEKILGNTPISTQYFRAKARYTYEIQEQATIEIKESDEPRKYELPNPPSSENAAEQISYVYQQYYTGNGAPIKKYCADLANSQVLSDTSKCACLVMSIIAQESNGNADVGAGDDGRSFGLMQIQQATAQGVWNDFGLEPCSLRDIECNIMSGTYYLKKVENYIKSNPPDEKVENYAAGYNGGTCNSETNNGSLCVAADHRTSCNGQLNWECQELSGYAGTRTTYVPHVMKRYDTCMQMNLFSRTIEDPTPEQSIVKAGEIALVFGDEQEPFEAEIKGTPYRIRAQKSGDKVNLGVYYKEIGDPYRLTSPIELAENEVYEPRFPFIRFTIKDNTLNYKYIENASSAKMTLLAGKTQMVSGQPVKDYADVFKGWVSAHFENEQITLYDAGTRAFCRAPWGSYLEQETGSCSEGSLFMLKIINDETFIKSLWQSWTDSTQDYARVQVQFDMNAEHSCCSDCRTCISVPNEALACISCPGCEVRPMGGSILCEQKSSS